MTGDSGTGRLGRRSALLAIAVGGGIAGTVDLLQACILFGWDIPLAIAGLDLHKKVTFPRRIPDLWEGELKAPQDFVFDEVELKPSTHAHEFYTSTATDIVSAPSHHPRERPCGTCPATHITRAATALLRRDDDARG